MRLSKKPFPYLRFYRFEKVTPKTQPGPSQYFARIARRRLEGEFAVPTETVTDIPAAKGERLDAMGEERGPLREFS
jgi:hypothetical protein